MKVIFAIFILSFVSGSLAMAKDCQQARSNYEIYECMKVQYKEVDTVLNVEYQKARSRILNSEFSSAEKTEALQTLLKAQRAWIAFRDTDCQLQAVEFVGGNGGGMQIQTCLVSKTQERVTVLKNLVNGRENPNLVAPE